MISYGDWKRDQDMGSGRDRDMGLEQDRDMEPGRDRDMGPAQPQLSKITSEIHSFEVKNSSVKHNQIWWQIKETISFYHFVWGQKIW